MMCNLRYLDGKSGACLAAVVVLLWTCLAGNAVAGSPDDQQGEEQSSQADSGKQAKGAERSWGIRWEDGLIVREPWNILSMRIGGLAQNDSTGFVTDLEDYETEQGRLEDAVQWRRGRLYAEGAFLKHFEYKFQYDFATRNPPKLKDAYFGSRKIPLPLPIPLGFRAGRFRTHIGLEGDTSSRDTLFMERSLPYAFIPSRNTGFVFFGKLPYDFDWGVGFIRGENEYLFDKNEKMGFVVSGARQFSDVKKGILRAGGNYQYRPVRENVRYLSRPETHVAPQFVDTGQIPAYSDQVMLLEGAWIRGPFSMQAEYGWTWVDGNGSAGQQDVGFHGGYIAGSYFLTDDDRSYSMDEGKFVRVVPKRPFGIDGGLGAWEVAFRYSHLDLDDRNIEGGVLNDFTAGVNWYPHSYFRFMFNTVYAKQNRLSGVWIFQVRLQVAL